MRKRSFFQRMTALVLASTLVISMFAACGKTATTGGEKVEDKVEPKIEATATPEPTEVPVVEVPGYDGPSAGFEETIMDLGGRTIKYVTTAKSRYTYAEDKDATTNETLEIIKAIESIEKDYNCVIEFEQLKGKDMVEALVTAQSAGDVYCDILEFGCSDTYLEQIYAGNLVMPLEDERIADIVKLDTNPWLPATLFGRMFGNQYGVHFKTNNSGDLLKGVVLFNKDLVEKYNLGNIYDLVNSKEWTFEKFEEMCADIAAQSDGTVYPLIYGNEGIFLPMFVYANGGTVAEYGDNKYEFTGLQDNTLEALNYAIDLKAKGYYHPQSEVSKQDEPTFANGEAVFFFGIYNSLKKYTQGVIPMEDSVGIVPAPIGPSGDGNYNAVSYTEAMFHVVDNVEKPEEVAAVLVALANRTGKRDMVETELMHTLQDEESGQMLQLMYDNMILDLSRSISTARSTVKGANQAILKMEKTPKEAYEEIATSVQTIFDELTIE